MPKLLCKREHTRTLADGRAITFLPEKTYDQREYEIPDGDTSFRPIKNQKEKEDVKS